MKQKSGVNLAGLDIRIRPALIACKSVLKELNKPFTITAGLDGEHSAGSLHYYGLAVDIRTRHLTSDEKSILYTKLTSTLDDNFDIILHDSHLHHAHGGAGCGSHPFRVFRPLSGDQRQENHDWKGLCHK